MAARVTIERILRDEDDAVGSTIRDWKIEAECGHVVIRLKHGDGFLMLRPSDIEIFTDDLARAKAAALDLT